MRLFASALLQLRVSNLFMHLLGIIIVPLVKICFLSYLSSPMRM